MCPARVLPNMLCCVTGPSRSQSCRKGAQRPIKWRPPGWSGGSACDRVASSDCLSSVKKLAALQMVWPFHHIVLHGSSLGVLNNHFFAFYGSIVGNNPHMVLQEAPSF